ncbi:MAG TPA: DUF1028 domain-containing protein, partial [Thermoleophilaceae bacterium]|nr:DUF1028 domain-containing protein [Thermoleophilaceae bacterium]
MTYSIVARDPASGELGVAVQSHFFGVGPVVAFAEAGVGAVATQAIVDPAYGPRGLDLMRGAGSSAPETLHRLLSEDPQEPHRQVAMLDRWGRVAVHTGGKCIAFAGHAVGEQSSAQANIMRDRGVPEAMVGAFRHEQGDLAARLLAALDGAQAAGGDLRGCQSAALLVVAARPGGGPSQERPFDLRVEDHHEPLRELRRLVDLKRAYDRAEAGDELAAEGDMEAALEQYAAARAAQPGSAELAFWHGVALAGTGREAEARDALAE